MGRGLRPSWPKGPTMWIDGRVLFVSIPFTWNLPDMRQYLHQRHASWDSAIVGGPAVNLMPDYLADISSVTIGTDMPGVLQRVNPMATRTTTGCIRKCGFCAIGTGKVEGNFAELSDWPDLPIVCDNNLLASSPEHFDRVLDRLEHHDSPDFNQGLDSRLLDRHHAERFARLRRPHLRLALDRMNYADGWERAFGLLRDAGCAKSWISSYALIGFDSDPSEAWGRCKWIESHGIKAYPMWFHALDALRWNEVTEMQRNLGWSDETQLQIMGYFYKHRGRAQ